MANVIRSKNRHIGRGYAAPFGKMDAGLIYVDPQILTLDLLDDGTGTVTTGYDSAGATAGATANEPVITYATGTPNARRGGGGAYMKASFASNDDSYFEIVFAAGVRLTAYDYIGFWIHSDTTVTAADYTMKLYDSQGIQLGATIDLPAITTTVWQRMEVDISGYRRSDIKKIRITDTTADNDVICMENLIAYKYGNGRGPVSGFAQKMLIDTGTITKGMGIATVAGKHGVIEAGDNSTMPVGIAIEGGTSTCLVLTHGRCFLRVLGTSMVVGDKINATATSKAFDDDTTAGQGFGMWRETYATSLGEAEAQIGTFS